MRKGGKVNNSSGADYRAFFEHSAVPAAIVGIDCTWSAVNPAFCDMYGYSVAEIFSGGLAQLVHPEDLSSMMGDLSVLLDGRLDVATGKRRFISRSGTVMWADSSITLVRSPSGDPDYFIVELIDITESEQTAAKLRESESRNRGLVDAAFDSISIIDADRLTIVDVNRATEEMLSVSRAELIGHNPLEFVPQELVEEYMGIFRDLLKTGENRYRGVSVQRHNGLPITTEVSSRFYQSDGHRYIVAITRDITEIVKAEEALAATENRYHSIYASVPISVWEVDLTEIWRFLESLIGAGVKDIAGYLMAHPDLVEAATAKMKVVDVNQVTVELFEADSKAEIMASFSKIFTKDTYRIFISQLTALALGKTASDEESTIVTLKGNEKYVRVTTNIPAPYGDIDRVVVCVTDITELRTAERYQSRIRELSETINIIDHALNSTHDVATIMQTVVHQTLAAVSCDSTGIALREGGEWILKYAAGDIITEIGQPLSLSHPLSFKLSQGAAKPWVSYDAIKDEIIQTDLAKEHQMHSMVAAPLVIRDEVIGVLFCVHQSDQVRFGDPEVDFASKLATSVSLALENARLYNEQLNIADTLQDSILRLPATVAGADFGAVYHSATEEARVGGDFYDIFRVSEDKLVIVIGDVSGKGLEASALTSVIKNTVRAYAYLENSPVSIVLSTNELIAAHTTRNVIASLFVGIVNASAKKLHYCNAGHPSPILKTPQGLILLEPTAPVLASVKYLPFRESSTRVTDEDVLILYTDGLTEARRGRELFGEKRLLELTAKIEGHFPQAWPEQIVEAVLEYSGGRLTDDAAVMAIQLKAGD